MIEYLKQPMSQTHYHFEQLTKIDLTTFLPTLLGSPFNPESQTI